jgi:uncharacterized protein YdhG (YjbR/CyaY superfamily)
MEKKGFTSIDEYIASFPEATQKLLQELRAAIRVATPEAQEKISYQIPTFALNGNLLSFAAFKNHIGIYPIPEGTAEFQQQVAPYRAAKSSLHLPLDKPLPLELIKQFVQFRVAETRSNAEQKAAKKTQSAAKTPSDD